MKDEDLIFAPEESTTLTSTVPAKKWKVLIVDDEEEVHKVTLLAMEDFDFEDGGLEFIHAYSGKEARQLLLDHQDVSLAVIDVVMESDHAGLDLVHYIRNELGNHLIRIILRTGQPGQAPERSVVRDYDINDYKEKSELSSQRLYSAVSTSLRSYRDIKSLDENRHGLEQVIDASTELFQLRGLNVFIQGVLKQIIALMNLESDSMYVNCHGMALECETDEIRIISATGQYDEYIGRNANDALPQETLEIIQEAMQKKCIVTKDNTYVGYFSPRPGRKDVIYIKSSKPLKDEDSNIIQLFLHNASIAYENILLSDEIESTQRDIIYMLVEAIESRSHETGQHVRRVAEYCLLIADGLGLSQHEIDILRIAAPLHDFGKIGIPDSILHKPGKLNDKEWAIMKTHAEIGQEMLGRSSREILIAASKLAGQHHERWDGTGYPKGLSGEDIHIFGRIGAVADVFDALGTKHCYKDAWPTDKIVDYFKQQSGQQFEPSIVEWVLNNLDKMNNVRESFPDDNA